MLGKRAVEAPNWPGSPTRASRGGVGDRGAGSLEPAKIAASIPFRALARARKLLIDRREGMIKWKYVRN